MVGNNPLEGYRLTFMKLDGDVVAVSPRPAFGAGMQSVEERNGFGQPLTAHQHSHIGVSFINISETFYYLCGILDGCSRYIVNQELRESMTDADSEMILERAKGTAPGGAGVRFDFGHDDRQNFAVPTASEREDRTLARRQKAA